MSNTMERMEALLLFGSIERALPAIAKLHKCGFEIEVLTPADYWQGTLLTQCVWICARGLYAQSEDDFSSWMDDFAAEYGAEMEQAGAGTGSSKQCFLAETRSTEEIASIRSRQACEEWP